MENRNDELTIDDLDLASGGTPELGIDYAHSASGKTTIQWGDSGGTWIMKEGQKGITYIPH